MHTRYQLIFVVAGFFISVTIEGRRCLVQSDGKGGRMGYRDGLKVHYVKLDALAALRAPVSALLGISGEVESTLHKLGLTTVFDLAASPLFRTAAEVNAAAEGQGGSVIARTGRVPGSFIDAGGPGTPASLVMADVSMLREIGASLGTEMKKRLQIETVGDLGRWPAFRAALEILDAAVALPNGQGDEANELVPKLGEYPTERRYYRSLVIDHVVPGETKDLAAAGPIDISPTVSSDFGFRAPAVGAMLTFAQSWYAQGITLGNLLHSVALAPGESTRIAVLDWARRTVGSGQENISEAEQLTNVSTHNRAISEVQDAVANEVQSGFSRTNASSTTNAGGGGFGLSLGPITLGGSGSSGSTSTNAESFSSSAGSRNLSATMNQRVADATQQAASSVRERRASVVKEVSEEEHESVSTRIIANYNHMHALTVQYFEVIEIYRVNVQLQQVERCLFVPMKLLNFTIPIIERYQSVLANAAIDRRARELLMSEFGMIVLQPTLPMKRFGTVFDRVAGLDRVSMSAAAAVRTAAVAAAAEPVLTSASTSATPAPTPAPMVMTAPIPSSWVEEEMARAARITMSGIMKPGKSDLYLPGEVELCGISFAISAQDGSVIALSSVQLVMQTGSSMTLASSTPVDWIVSDPIPLQEIDQFRISSASASRFTGKMTLQLIYGGSRFPITLPVDIVPHAALQQVCRVAFNERIAELKAHLEQHRLHYSQAIWRSMDPSSIALLLSSFTFEGMPVADMIDPNPQMVAGNYLVFRMPGFVEAAGISSPASDENTAEAEIRKKWKSWLAQRGLVLGSESSSEQLVPVPTGGIFAEAVLGRSNSAERLDATRFWNWQDSPIPLQPPEIAAIQMGSRAQPVDVTPGQLGAPVVNITNPTPLPDPTGVGAIIGAMQNGNMFRDMSGLAATAGLAQALSSNATTAGTEAGKQAAANLAVAAQKDIEEKRIAAQLAMAAMGLPSGSGGSPKNISESGALLNTAAAMDAQSPKAGSPISGGAGGLMESGGGGSSDGSFMPGVPSSLKSQLEGGSRADDVLSKMTWGNLGTSGGNLVLASSSATGTSTSPGITGTTYLEICSYAVFPRPWADDQSEIQGMQDGKWYPSEEDFDAVATAATYASQGTKPYAQVMNTMEDMVNSVTYFAPKLPGFSTVHPSRIVRLNLFLYAGAENLQFSGTLKTEGTWVSIFGPTLDLKASVVDIDVLNNIKSNTANSATLTALKSAWGARAEIWLYCCGGVPNDALAQAFATVIGAKVRAFDKPFWVLPRFDPVQKVILARDEFGIGDDFSAAAATRTSVLHGLDLLSTRSFSP